MCSSACSGEESSSTTRIGEGASAGGSEGAALVELEGGAVADEGVSDAAFESCGGLVEGGPKEVSV